MNKILILFAHQRFEKSKTNRALLKNVGRIDSVTVNDLYEQYPDFNVDTDREKMLLMAHQIIVWHHPFYMYSAPALPNSGLIWCWSTDGRTAGAVTISIKKLSLML